MTQRLDKLVDICLQKDYEVKYWDNPRFVIDTNRAPSDAREFILFVRKSIDHIMDEVKSDSIVNDKFHVELEGEQSERYVKTAQRLGRKAYNQRTRMQEEFLALQSQPIVPGNEFFSQVSNVTMGAVVGESFGNNTYGIIGGFFYNGIIEGVGTTLINQVRSAMGFGKIEFNEESKNSLKTLANTVVGGVIGYSVAPEQPVIGATTGAFIGNIYNSLVQLIELPARAVFNEAKRITFDEIRLNRRYPLARKADEYERFGRTIANGYVVTR